MTRWSLAINCLASATNYPFKIAIFVDDHCRDHIIVIHEVHMSTFHAFEMAKLDTLNKRVMTHMQKSLMKMQSMDAVANTSKVLTQRI